MKAIVQSRYGPVDDLALTEVDVPPVGDDEVLVRVRAASMHPDVWHMLAGRPYVLRMMGAGLRRPRTPIPGTDLAGEVASVGGAVTRWKPGDAVFGESSAGFSWRNGGTFAEYVAVPEKILAAKPENVSFEQAAAAPTAGFISLINYPAALRDRPGAQVLVNGAGGNVGSTLLQLAKSYQATVTAVDHTDKVELLRVLGADHVIDYTREDFTTSATRFDLVLDVPGNRPFREIRRVLTPKGLYVLIGHDQFGAEGRRWFGSIPRFVWMMVRSPFVPHFPRPEFTPEPKGELMAQLAALLERGALAPVIDRTFPLERMPDAARYLTEGNARGRIIITI